MKINKILSILNSPLIIKESSFYGIVDIYNKYRTGPKIEMQKPGKKSALSQEKENNKDSKPYQIINGKAVIKIDGVLMKNPGAFLKMCFGVNDLVEIGENIKQAGIDRDVNMVSLKIDSPGGTVDGTEDTANIVREVAKIKPVIAYVDGMMASGAYWIGSAAHEIFISGKTAELGSIGVATYHVDKSEFYNREGIKFTDIYSGKYKRMVTETKPLSEEGKEYIQDHVDEIYKIFVDNVAENRGVSTEKVLSDMADGKIFLGENAISAGLADGVMPFDDVLMLNPGEINFNRRENKKIKTEVLNKMPTQTISVDEIKDNHPEIYNAIKSEGKEEAEKEFEKKIKSESESFESGVNAENERIVKIYSFLMPGRESVIGECLKDVKCSAGDAGIKIVTEEKKALGEQAKVLNEELPDPLNHDKTPDKTNETEKDTSKMTVEERAKHTYATDKKIQKEFSSEAVFVAYCKQKESEKESK